MAQPAGPAGGGEPRAAPAGGEGPPEPGAPQDALSLEEILRLYNQPINEEQAWAVCYQCCGSLRAAAAGRRQPRRRVRSAAQIHVWRDGAVTLAPGDAAEPPPAAGKLEYSHCTETEVEEDGTFGGGGGGGAGAERLESVLESGCLLQSDVALRPENDWTRADVVEGAGELWGFPTLFQGQTVFKVMLRSYLPFYFRSVKSVQWNFSRLRDCMTVAVISECLQEQVIESLGIIIYKALDYGLKENEERELSPPLEQLIDRMANTMEAEASNDEGYEAVDEGLEDEDGRREVSAIRSYRDVMKLCAAHLPTESEAPNHYQAVCRALFAETMELHTFLTKIKSAKENLKKIQEMEKSDESNTDLEDLKNADWARFWVQVMRDLRNGVKLKKVQERQYNPLPIEYQLTPYEMLMDDIRSRRYTLRKVMVNGDIPPRLKKSAHEIILDFIRSRPPLNPVSARKLKPTPPRPRSLHERILEEIKAERKLRPVSPEEIRRSRLDVTTPESPKNVVESSMVNGGLTSQTKENGLSATQQVPVQRKKLLKAPTLAELDSSDSEGETLHKSTSSSSVSPSFLEDPLLEAVSTRKKPPKFLPISSTPQPERRQPPQRRHSIEKETPTNVRQFLAPSKQSSRSLVPRITSVWPRTPFRPLFSTIQTASLLSSHPFEAAMFGVAGAMYYLCERAFTSRWKSSKEEFCYPVECLALTVEEVMHIRQVLVKAELEKYQQYKDVYTALKKGKLCFCCRTRRFSFFTWSYTCQFCKRPVCSQCCKKMRLPSKPYSTLPIFSLGPSALQRGESCMMPEKPSTGHHRPLRSIARFSSKSKSVDKSDEELQFPKELMEDWSTMEVCVDCKKFISEIISSSRRSLVLANKRARLKRKTQSFYMSSPGPTEYCPSERTINEI
ncbi:protein spire homolog 1 isoform X2 [Equus przewalskii]|uniref:Protein spire homolog 1 isoform X2 n=2 Tax=Equus TaxID=9789 RepID=A0ABM4Q889_EQUPR